MKINKENVIVKLTLEFALKIIEYAESKFDFIHKMKIAAKEADEAEYWIVLCQLSKNYPKNEKLNGKLQVIINILAKIIITSKAN